MAGLANDRKDSEASFHSGILTARFQMAEIVEDAKKLGKAGFGHYDTIGSGHLYRRRK